MRKVPVARSRKTKKGEFALYIYSAIAEIKIEQRGGAVLRKHLRTFEENQKAISYGEQRVKGHC